MNWLERLLQSVDRYREDQRVRGITGATGYLTDRDRQTAAIAEIMGRTNPQQVITLNPQDIRLPQRPPTGPVRFRTVNDLMGRR